MATMNTHYHCFLRERVPKNIQKKSRQFQRDLTKRCGDYKQNVWGDILKYIMLQTRSFDQCEEPYIIIWARHTQDGIKMPCIFYLPCDCVWPARNATKTANAKGTMIPAIPDPMRGSRKSMGKAESRRKARAVYRWPLSEKVRLPPCNTLFLLSIEYTLFRLPFKDTPFTPSRNYIDPRFLIVGHCAPIGQDMVHCHFQHAASLVIHRWPRWNRGRPISVGKDCA